MTDPAADTYEGEVIVTICPYGPELCDTPATMTVAAVLPDGSISCLIACAAGHDWTATIHPKPDQDI